MTVTLPLAQMTTQDKLSLLETLWDNLLATGDTLPSPAWHRDVLAAREMRVREGTAVYSSWSEAKDRIRRKAHHED